MNIEKFNDEEMYLKANVKFNNGDCETLYIHESLMPQFVSRNWNNPYFAYTDNIDMYFRCIDDIQMIHIETEATLTETEYDTMLDTLVEVNSKRIDTIKVISDEIFMEDIIRAALERCSK